VSELPPDVKAVRRRIAAQYLQGTGLEIGALHSPLEVSGLDIRYVDRLTVDGLRRHYPELDSFALTPVDIVDDGEKLISIPDESQNFIIANHMLEHTENPLGTIRSHLAKLQHGAMLYYAIPDKRHSFDRDRPLTDFSHLVADDKDDGASSRYDHFLEWATLVCKAPDALDSARKNMDANYSIHFHVWDASHWLAFLVHARQYLDGRFDILHFECNSTEVISILSRR
jgi:hypothetical protein